MLKQLNEKLIQFGLTNKEAVVYTAMLVGGEMTAEDISKQAKLNRSTTYVQLKQLMEDGLASTFKRGKKTFFAAESPRNLERIINKKSEVIEKQKADVMLLVPELLRVYGTGGERPVVRVFEGKEGLTTMRYEMLNSKPEDVRIITSIDQMRKIFSPDELAAFSELRESMKIKSRVLYFIELEENVTPFKFQELKRVTKDQLPFGADMYIYGDSVSYATTEQSVTGVTITNKDVANTMRALFESSWNSINN